MSVRDEIQATIQNFAQELEALVRQAALAAVAEAFGPGVASSLRLPAASAPRRGRPPKARPGVSALPRPSAGAPAAPKAKKGGKRDPKEIAALVDAVAAWVKANPGQRVEQMAKSLRRRTSELTLPITKLLAAKAIKKKGQKRATSYFPA